MPREDRGYAAVGTGERCCCLLRLRRRVDPDVNDVPSNCVALLLVPRAQSNAKREEDSGQHFARWVVWYII